MDETAEQHLHLYSVIRIVPIPRTGEYINVAVIVINPATNAWTLRQTGTDTRALRLAPATIIGAVNSMLTKLATGNTDMSEAMLRELRSQHRNVMQFSEIMPVVARDLTAAADIVFGAYVVEE